MDNVKVFIYADRLLLIIRSGLMLCVSIRMIERRKQNRSLA